MTVPYSVATNDVVQAADVNQYKNLLEGASAYTATYALTSTAGTNFSITLGDAGGGNKLSIKDSGGVEVAYIDSDGVFHGSLSLGNGTITIPTSATPTQTTEGSIAWDTDDDVLTIGTGAATKRIGLTRGAGSSATAANELVYDTTAAQLKVWDGSASQGVGYKTTTKYSTATQTITTSTTLVDIITSGSGTASFAIAANEVWHVEFQSYVSYGGTGGLKMQLTGPAAPTAVNMSYLVQTYTEQTSDGTEAQYDMVSMRTGVIAAFSTASLAMSSTAATQSGTTGTDRGIQNGMVRITGIIANGSTAGTVAFQGAQNSSNSTTVFGVGTFMRAERIA